MKLCINWTSEILPLPQLPLTFIYDYSPVVNIHVTGSAMIHCVFAGQNCYCYWCDD